MDGWRREIRRLSLRSSSVLAGLSHDADQSAHKQTEHTPARWKQKHPGGPVQPYKAELCPSVPGAERQTLI